MVQIAVEPLQVQVKRLEEKMLELWWESDTTLPVDFPVYSSRQQEANEKQLGRLLAGLEMGLKRAPAAESEREALRQRILDVSFGFIRDAFGFEESQLELVRRGPFIGVVEQFAAAARRYDPAISSDDIYQASRNVSSMNLMQLLLGRPVELTPAVFAYSMLYPYTDNYLDDPSIPMSLKRSFNQRFWNRLAGQPAAPQGTQEERIWDLVSQVEGQFQRERFPQVYESLLAIHEAQFRSLRQLRLGASPYEVDVLRLSFEKGGASTLADGYLVAGQLSEEQAAFTFSFGAFTQLMDDLEDVESDRKAGSMTVFSQTAGHYPLDGILNRLYSLGRTIFGGLEAFHIAEAGALRELTLKSLLPLLSFSAALLPAFFTPPYLRRLETSMPLRFNFLRRQRQKLERDRSALIRFLEN